MHSSNISVPQRCPRCGSAIQANVQVAARGTVARVSRSVRCSVCGYAEERDRRDVLPEIADLFYARDDRYALTVTAVAEPGPDAVAALAEAFALDPKQAKRRLDGLPEERPVVVGLECILLELRDYLADAGIQSEVAKVFEPE